MADEGGPSTIVGDRSDGPRTGAGLAAAFSGGAAIWELRDRARSSTRGTMIALVNDEGTTSLTGNVTIPSVSGR